MSREKIISEDGDFFAAVALTNHFAPESKFLSDLGVAFPYNGQTSIAVSKQIRFSGAAEASSVLCAATALSAIRSNQV